MNQVKPVMEVPEVDKEVAVTPLKAVAFDPGITTGWAVGMIKDGLMTVRSGENKWKHVDLYAQLVAGAPDFVVWETFQFRKYKQHEGVELYPKELIGVIHLYVQLQPVNTVVGFQQPPMKSAGSFYSNTKLKADGLYKPGEGHAMDALRHLLHWYTFGGGYKFNIKGYK